MKWLLSLLGLGGGPVGWLAMAAGWAKTALDFVLKHWKVFSVIAAVIAVFYAGMRHERADWEERWAARDAEDKQHEVERIRTNHDLQIVYEHIDGEAATKEAKRQKDYADIEKKVKDYVAKNHGSTSCGIGDDGLQLVVDAIRARRPH